MHGARANLVKTCNRQSVTTAPSFGLVQYCWQAMGILHLPKISQTSALPEIIASMLQPTKTVARLSPPQWPPFPPSIPLKIAIVQLKKQTSGGRWGKRPPFPLPIVPRALSFCLSPALYDTKRERASIQTINYHSRLRHYTVMVLNCTKVCVSFGCFSFICFSFLLFSGWLYSYKRNLLSVLQKTAVLTNPINHVKYILKNYYLVTVNKNRFARVTITLHVS